MNLVTDRTTSVRHWLILMMMIIIHVYPYFLFLSVLTRVKDWTHWDLYYRSNWLLFLSNFFSPSSFVIGISSFLRNNYLVLGFSLVPLFPVLLLSNQNSTVPDLLYYYLRRHWWKRSLFPLEPLTSTAVRSQGTYLQGLTLCYFTVLTFSQVTLS